MRQRHRAAALATLLLLAACACARAMHVTTYFSNWAQYRQNGCKWFLKDFPAKLATQAVYAFAFLNETTLAPKLLEWNDEELIAQMQDLKKDNPDLRTLIAIGGWTMNEPGSGYEHLFSQMVASPENRTAFITSTLDFLEKYGFDGLDLDWEYPGMEERGGRPEDKQNFASLVQELRIAMNMRAKERPFLLTLAVAASPSGWAGLDLPNLEPAVDFFNLMAYDFHGDWEQTTNFHTPWEDPQTGLDIKSALSYYTDEQGVPASKMVLGLGLYGRSWTLDSADAGGLGAAAAEPGKKGDCTRNKGFLGWREISAMLDKGAVESVDSTALAAYAVLGDQWVSFDNKESLGYKVAKARELSLGGVMVWAADLDDKDYSMMKHINEVVTE